MNAGSAGNSNLGPCRYDVPMRSADYMDMEIFELIDIDCLLDFDKSFFTGQLSSLALSKIDLQIFSIISVKIDL
jgi:hypothetical protein